MEYTFHIVPSIYLIAIKATSSVALTEPRGVIVSITYDNQLHVVSDGYGNLWKLFNSANAMPIGWNTDLHFDDSTWLSSNSGGMQCADTIAWPAGSKKYMETNGGCPKRLVWRERERERKRKFLKANSDAIADVLIVPECGLPAVLWTRLRPTTISICASSWICCSHLAVV